MRLELGTVLYLYRPFLTQARVVNTIFPLFAELDVLQYQ